MLEYPGVVATTSPLMPPFDCVPGENVMSVSRLRTIAVSWFLAAIASARREKSSASLSLGLFMETVTSGVRP